jgi:hypothetical protein
MSSQSHKLEWLKHALQKPYLTRSVRIQINMLLSRCSSRPTDLMYKLGNSNATIIDLETKEQIFREVKSMLQRWDVDMYETDTVDPIEPLIGLPVPIVYTVYADSTMDINTLDINNLNTPRRD